MKVVLTEKAEDDLIRIADYIARDNPERAISFIRELRDAALQLGDLDGIYPSSPDMRTCVFVVASKAITSSSSA